MSKIRCFSESLITDMKDKERYELIKKSFPEIKEWRFKYIIGAIQTEDNNLEIPTVNRVKCFLNENEAVRAIRENEAMENAEFTNRRRFHPLDFTVIMPHFSRVSEAMDTKHQYTHSKIQQMLDSALRLAGINVVIVEDGKAAFNKLINLDENFRIYHDKLKNISGIALDTKDSIGQRSIILVQDKMRPGTRIHEYTHIWSYAMQEHRPELWKKIKAIMLDRNQPLKGVFYKGNDGKDVEAKNIGEYLDHLKDEYVKEFKVHNEGDDYWAGELLANITEQIGVSNILESDKVAKAEKKIDERHKLEDSNKEIGPLTPAENDVRNLEGLKTIHDAIRRFWKYVTEDLFHLKAEKFSAKRPADISKYVLNDLLKGTSLLEIGNDNDELQSIKDKATKVGTYMKAPNGKKTNLTERQWLIARTKGFKRLFGDWDMESRFVNITDTNDISFKNNDDANKYFREKFKKGDEWISVKNKDTGYEIKLSSNGFNKSVSNDAVDKSDVGREEHLKALGKIDKIIEDSVLLEREKDRTLDQNIIEVQRYYGAVNIDGVVYRTKVTVKKVRANERNQNKQYSFEVDKIKLEKESSETQTLRGPNRAIIPHSSSNLISLAKLLNNVTSSDKSGRFLTKKFEGELDENGEPKSEMLEAFDNDFFISGLEYNENGEVRFSHDNTDYTFNVSNEDSEQVIYDNDGRRVDLSALEPDVYRLLVSHLAVINRQAVIVEVKGRKYFVMYDYNIVDFDTGETMNDRITNNRAEIWDTALKHFTVKGIRTVSRTRVGNNSDMRMKMMSSLINDVGAEKASEIVEQLANTFSILLDIFCSKCNNTLFRESFGIKEWSTDMNVRRKVVLDSGKAVATIIRDTYNKIVKLPDSKYDRQRPFVESVIKKHGPILMYQASAIIQRIEGFSLLSRVNVFSSGFSKIGWNLSLKQVSKNDVNGEFSTKDSEEKEFENDDAYTVLHEGWMDKQNTKSVYETTSRVMRRLTSSIVSNQKTFNGYMKMISHEEVSATLLDVCSKCEHPKDMVPAILKKAETIPWLNQVAKLLLGRNAAGFYPYFDGMSDKHRRLYAMYLQANMWKDFHKAHTKFVSYVQSSQEGATPTMKKVDNTRTGSNDNMMREFESVVSNSIVLDGKTSIYTKDGLYNDSTNEERKALVDTIEKAKKDGNGNYTFKSPDEVVSFAESFRKLLVSFGLDIDFQTIAGAFASAYKPSLNGSYKKINELVELAFKAASLSSNSHNKYHDRRHGSNESVHLKQDIRRYVRQIISGLSEYLTSKTEGYAIVTLVGERKKYWTFGRFNELHRIFDIILQSPEKANERYMGDSWFRNGEGNSFVAWLNSIIDGKFRPALEQVAAFDRKEFKNMTVKEFLECKFHVFFSEENKEDGERRVLLPSFADVDSRFSTNIPFEVNDIDNCARLMTDIVLQEWSRICAVRVRKSLPDEKKIANFDETGELFHYFPELNEKGRYSEVTVACELASTNPDAAIRKISGIMRGVLERRLEDFIRKLETEGVIPKVKIKGRKEFSLLEFDSSMLSGLQGYDLEKALRDVGRQIERFGVSVLHGRIDTRFDKNELVRIDDEIQKIRERIAFYFLNENFANIQLEELLFGDPSYCKHQSKDAADLQKRIKQVLTPVEYAYDTQYMYENPLDKSDNRIVEVNDFTRKKEYSITLKDIVSDMSDDKIVNAVFNGLLKNGSITREQLTNILDGLSEITETDGQSLRSVSSQLRMLCMTGQISDIYIYEAIERLKNGEELKKSDHDLIRLEVQKPFVSAVSERSNAAVAQYSEYDKLHVRTQHKNSEFPMLYGFKQIESFDYPVLLRGLSVFMEKYGIDKINFVSVEKDGSPLEALDVSMKSIKEWKEARKDSNSDVSADDISDYCAQRTGLSRRFREGKKYSDKEKEALLESTDSTYVHRIQMDDWGISTDMGEYKDDVNKRALGSQPQTMVLEDIPDDAVTDIVINERTDADSGLSAKTTATLTKKGLLNVYNKLINDDITKRFEKITGKFKNPRQIRNEITNYLISQGKSNDDELMYYLELNATDTRFIHSWLNPAVSERFESIITSMYRKDVQKRKIKMDVLPQVSAFGYGDDLAARFMDENGRILLKRKEFDEGKMADQRQQEWCDNAREKYKTYEEYIDAHSKSRLRILYFETAISPYMFYGDMKTFVRKDGSFDYNGALEVINPKAREYFGYRVPFESKHSGIPCFIKYFLPIQNAEAVVIAREWLAVSDSDNDADKLYCVFQETDKPVKDNKGNVVALNPTEFRLKGDIRKRKGESDADYVERMLLESIESNSHAANNNLLLNLITGVLQTDYNTGRIFTPGGFQTIQKVAAGMQQLMYMELSEEQRKNISEGKVDGKIKADAMSSYTDPTSQAVLFERNGIANKLISVFAVERAFATFFSMLNTRLNGEVSHIRLNDNTSIPVDSEGKRTLTLGTVKNSKKQYVTDMLGEFLGSAVDGIKMPCLSQLGITMRTAPLVMMLCKMGYDIWEACYFIRLPVIQDVFGKAETGSARLADSISAKLKKLDGVMSEPLTNANMTEQIYNFHHGLFTRDSVDKAALEMLSELIEPLEFYEAMILDNRAHTGSNLKSSGVQNLASGFLRKRMEAKTDLAVKSGEPLPVENSEKFFESYRMETVVKDKYDELLSDVKLLQPETDMLKTQLPFINMYNTYVHEGIRRLFDKFNVTHVYKKGVEALLNMAQLECERLGKNLRESDVSAIAGAAADYFMSRCLYESGTNESYNEQRRNIVNTVPEMAMALKEHARNNRSMPGRGLIMNLRINQKEGHLEFSSTDSVTAMKCKLAWRELFERRDEELFNGINCGDFAVNLARYQLVRAGFVSGYHGNIVSMFPLDCYDYIPGYVNVTNSLEMFDENDVENIENILDQYVAHSWSSSMYGYSDEDNKGTIRSRIPFIGVVDLLDVRKGESDISRFEFADIVDISKNSDLYIRLKGRFKEKIPKYFVIARGGGLMACYKVISDTEDRMQISLVPNLGVDWELKEYEYGKSPCATADRGPEIESVVNSTMTKVGYAYIIGKYKPFYDAEGIDITSDDLSEETKKELNRALTDAFIKELNSGNENSGVSYRSLQKEDSDELGNTYCMIK